MPPSLIPTEPAAPQGQRAPGLRPQYRSITRQKGFKLSADVILTILVRGSAGVVVLMLASLIFVLAQAAVPSMKQFGWAFLTKSEWRPNELEQPKRDLQGKIIMEDGETVYETLPPDFGALPVIYGTAVSSMLALIIAVPLSLGAALFPVRVAPRLRIAAPVSFLIEFLAAIPSIAYGLWALFIMAPVLQNHVEPFLAQKVFANIPGMRWMLTDQVTIGGKVIERTLSLTGRDMLAGGLILAVMILPIITRSEERRVVRG